MTQENVAAQEDARIFVIQYGPSGCFNLGACADESEVKQVLVDEFGCIPLSDDDAGVLCCSKQDVLDSVVQGWPEDLGFVNSDGEWIYAD